MENKKLFLLDAMALIYRSHFALSKNPIINSKGINTGAVLGFCNSLWEIITKENPTHIGVAFDTEQPTFRHVAYTEYKANRERQPEEISIAIPVIKKILAGFDIPVLEMDGYEADDIIGTIAKKIARPSHQVFMMTPDKDFAQLVDKQIFFYKPSRMGSSVDILGEKEVLEKFDIDRVEQVIDVLGLKGDSIDNIPGIPGIGDKTASKLLREYGSVENIIENKDHLKGAIKKKIELNGHLGIISKRLATINTQVPIEVKEHELLYKGPNKNILAPVFDELEFRSLFKRVFYQEEKEKDQSTEQLNLFSNKPETEIAQKSQLNIKDFNKKYKLITKADEVNKLVDLLLNVGEFCFDTETTGLDPILADLVGISFSWKKDEAYYIHVPEKKEDVVTLLAPLKEIFENNNIGKVGQNLKFDIQILRNYGFEVKGKIFDTMLAHYLIEPEGKHSFDSLSGKYLNYSPIGIESLIGPKGSTQCSMRDVDIEKIVPYASEDADITYQLKGKIEKELKDLNLTSLLYDVEQPLSFVLADMEYLGVCIDVDALNEMSKSLEALANQAENQVYEMAGENFNLGSPKQLGVILFEKLKLIENPKKTKTGQYATGEDILSKLANQHVIASQILEYREYQKLNSTYVTALPKLVNPIDRRIHTDYRQTVTVTGRLSSNNPNLQNIPIRTSKGREIRKAFIPQNNDFVIMSADYSQIELRIMASFSKDKSMMNAFENGRDIHTNTASKIFNVPLSDVEPNMRRKAKEVNFGIIYGISAFGLSQNLNISRKEASEIIKSYFKEFPAVKVYMDNVINKAKEKGYVETVLGRRRYLKNINSRNHTMRGYDERNAINAPIQGSAADMIKIAMIDIHKYMKMNNIKSNMIMQVHDELVFETHKSEVSTMKNKIEKFMKNALPLKVPVEVEIGVGNNWLEAH